MAIFNSYVSHYQRVYSRDLYMLTAGVWPAPRPLTSSACPQACCSCSAKMLITSARCKRSRTWKNEGNIHEKIPELNGGVVFFWEKYPRPIAGWFSVELITRVSFTHVSSLMVCSCPEGDLNGGVPKDSKGMGVPPVIIQSSWMTTTRIET